MNKLLPPTLMLLAVNVYAEKSVNFRCEAPNIQIEVVNSRATITTPFNTEYGKVRLDGMDLRLALDGTDYSTQYVISHATVQIPGSAARFDIRRYEWSEDANEDTEVSPIWEGECSEVK